MPTAPYWLQRNFAEFFPVKTNALDDFISYVLAQGAGRVDIQPRVRGWWRRRFVVEHRSWLADGRLAILEQKSDIPLGEDAYSIPQSRKQVTLSAWHRGNEVRELTGLEVRVSDIDWLPISGRDDIDARYAGYLLPSSTPDLRERP